MTTQISQQEIQQTAVRLGIPDHPFVARRIARAFDLVETNKVNEVSHDDGLYRVHSQYDDKIYTVELNHGNPSCTCPDNERTIFCKHSIASMMTAFEQEQKATSLIVKATPHNEKVKASWVVIDGKYYVTVWQDLNGKVCCVCGAYYKRDCIHKQAIREFYANGKGSKIVSESGTANAKALQDKLNGNNGTGDTQSPVHHQLDVNNPFEECEARDIDQINGNANGDLAHKLSNGEYVISYNGIMALAEQHGVTFIRHTVKSDAKRDGTVIAHARLGTCTRASGKPMNGSFITAIELAKRNAARQLLPLPEIKALEHKAKLEAEFDWEVAKRKCLEIVPDFTFDILINDLVKAGTLRQAHSSDYSRKEWLVIFDACKCDAEINGNDDDDGAGNTASSPDKFTECREVAKDFVRFQWLKSDMLKEGVVSDDWTDDDIEKLKQSCEVDASLFGKQLGHFEIDIQPNANNPWRYDRRYRFWLMPMSRRCFWCAETKGVMPDTVIEWGRYTIKTSLCLECSEKLGNGELDKDAIIQKFDTLYYKGYAPPSEPDAEVPDNVDDFIAKCKEMERAVLSAKSGNLPRAEVDDPAPMVEGAQMDGDDKRKLQMDAKLKTWLVEPDGTKKEISCREICEQFDGNIVMQLRSGIDAGGDISTVELDN